MNVPVEALTEIVAGYFVDDKTVINSFIATNDIKDTSNNPIASRIEDLQLKTIVPRRGNEKEVLKLELEALNLTAYINKWLFERPGYPTSLVNEPLEGLQMAWVYGGTPTWRELSQSDWGIGLRNVIEVPQLEEGWHLLVMGRQSYTSKQLGVHGGGSDLIQRTQNALRDALRQLGLETETLKWTCMPNSEIGWADSNWYNKGDTVRKYEYVEPEEILKSIMMG